MTMKKLSKEIELKLKVISNEYCNDSELGHPNFLNNIESIDDFIDKIIKYDDILCDLVGQYRGTFCYECLDDLIMILDKNDLDDVIKNKIIEGYKLNYRMDED
jgi:hypothetical protein